MNEAHRLAGAEDWNNPRWEALWLYNLHYFDDLCAEGTVERAGWHRALIARWIAENPVGRSCGWDPYPTSLRIVNWIKWVLSNGDLNEPARHSLAIQARRLASRIEWHLLGNHLLANAKGLVFAGCFFEGAEAQRWLNTGMEILEAQLDEQVLADGGHFERSPMYHAIVLEDVLDLINLSNSYPGVIDENLLASLRLTVGRMQRWAHTMSHPDGGIAFFNDAAFGIAAESGELGAYAKRLGIEGPRGYEHRLVAFEESGYIRLAQGPMTVLFDVGAVGPDYLPGHAHADTLSFELSWGRQRVICNSGTSCYGRGAIRHWERSTAAHNTVEIDGENSSEAWDGFRVARRAYPVGLSCSEDAEALHASCAHDGYRRLPGRPMHRRTIELTGNAVRWTDEVEGVGEHRAIGRIPLHPDVTARRLGEAQWQLDLPSGDKLMLALEMAGVRLDKETGRYSPEFGLSLERSVLFWAVSGRPPFSIAISLRSIER
ncbi:MAG: alginate lyase family protein [Proteobacteria bacterium]|nr:alginate lyase family protein [Pseudomonadota bacterium]